MAPQSKETSEKEKRQSIDKLRFQQIIAMEQIQQINSFLDADETSAISANMLDTKLELLERYAQRFNTLQSQIEMFMLDADDQIQRRLHFDEVYCQVKAKFAAKLKSSAEPRSSIFQSAIMPSSKSSHRRLPKIQLPKFSGNYSEWLDYFGMFKSLVDDDADIPTLEKFQYLKSSLEGNAKLVVGNMDPSEENYPKAIALLKARYDNKKLIFQTHIKDICEIKAAEKGSANTIRFIADTVNSHVRAMLSLGNKEQIADGLLIYLISRKLDYKSHLKWEEHSAGTDILKFDQFVEFLNKHSQKLENVEGNASSSDIKGSHIDYKSQPFGKSTKTNFHKRASSFISTQKPSVCSFCAQTDHQIGNCSRFAALTPANRFTHVKRLRLCLNCLKPNHIVKECTSSKCRICRGNHHTLIHLGTNTGQNSPQQTSNSSPIVDSSAHHNIVTSENTTVSNTLSIASTNSMQTNNNSFLFLATANILVKNKFNELIKCRAILDSASHINIISERLVQLLQLQKIDCNTTVSGVGENSHNIKHKVELHIKSVVNNFTANIEAIVMRKITGYQPIRSVNINSFNIPKNVTLADEQFCNSTRVDILIGVGLFFELMCVGQIKLDSGPILQKTVLGWIVAGGVGNNININNINSEKFVHITTSDSDHNNSENLDYLLEKFWQIEHLKVPINKFNLEEIKCEEHFKNFVNRDVSGKVIVKLPFRENFNDLGESESIAVKRFCNLEKKLLQNSELKDNYSKFIREYKELNHMSRIDRKDIPRNHFFLPHHGVFNHNSSSTKLRVVFDGSCKTSTGLSLNDVLMVGPTIQPELFAILIRFRSYKFVVCADIRKMYRQVLIDKPDNYYQLILWRNNPSDELEYYRLNTVTYGTSSAPFLAIRALQEIAHAEKERFPTGCQVIISDFYVDNLMTGGDKLVEVSQKVAEVSRALNCGGFPLHKWCSNNPSLISHIPVVERESCFHIDDKEVVKALGLFWNNSSDELYFNYSVIVDTSMATKRSILATIARLFDPLGIINPIIVRAKIFMQHLWKQKIAWDESLPQELCSQWQTFKEQLKDIADIKVPRYISSCNKDSIQLHGFADASSVAYGTCLYLRSLDEFGNIKVRLITAKSRVAPTKTLTIPRLELNAALLLAELSEKVSSSLEIDASKIFCWTDSLIALAWLNSPSYQWKTYVAARVTQIQELSKGISWNHVPTHLNPADIVSRGSLPKDLIANKLWFEGPNFLLLHHSSWPTSRHIPTNIQLPEKRNLKYTLKIEHQDSPISRCWFVNSFVKIRNSFAYIFRFIKNSKLQNSQRTFGSLTVQEIYSGHNYLIRSLQKIEFGSEYSKLMTDRNRLRKLLEPIEKSKECLDQLFEITNTNTIDQLLGEFLFNRSNIEDIFQKYSIKFDEDEWQELGKVNVNSQYRSLNPFLDQECIIRVGGRIKNSTLSFDAKHQILLPSSHPISKSIVAYYHNKNFHAGCQALLALVRQKYWPINARNLCKHIIHRCIKCFRYQPKASEQFMGDLPPERTQLIRPFLVTGIDFCGPFYTHYQIRGKKPTKTYICVFICFATKAVHLELVADLSSDAFIAALKRFVGRRGKCSTIFSDNGTNFVGANSQLKELHNLFHNEMNFSKIKTHCLDENINWKFSPPYSPHFGGLYEAAVKIAKRHLQKIVGTALLTSDELHTIIVQIEAIMNSRPLTPISSDPNDLEILTPGHFLIGCPLTSIPEPTVEFLQSSIHKRYQRLRILYQHFWSRFNTEYLNTLQVRAKWSKSFSNIKPGDMVIVKENNLPPMKWLLGRVRETSIGSDGFTRVAVVNTKQGEMKRAITRLCPLPMST